MLNRNIKNLFSNPKIKSSTVVGLGFTTNNITSGTAWDWADVGVNTLGLAVTGLTYFGYVSNPYGWAIGAIVLGYNGYRLYQSLSPQENNSLQLNTKK